VSPWIEEFLKALPLVFLIRTRRVGLQVDAAIVGLRSAPASRSFENVYYLTSRPDAMLVVQVIRGFGTAIMHGGATAIFGDDLRHDLRKKADERPLHLPAGLPRGGRVALRIQLPLVRPVLANARHPPRAAVCDLLRVSA